MTKTKPLAIGNGLLAILFFSIGAVNALAADFMSAGVWLSLAAALAVLGSEATPWVQIQLWRRALGAALTCAAIALIAATLWTDFTN